MKLALLFTIVFASVCLGANADKEEKFVNYDLLNSIAIKEGPEWRNFVENAEEIREFIQEFLIAQEVKPRMTPLCQGCKYLFDILMHFVKNEQLDEAELSQILAIACVALNLSGLHKDVCDGAVGIYLPHVMQIFTLNEDLKGQDVCRFLLGGTIGMDACEIGGDVGQYINVTIDTNKPGLVDSDYLPDNTPAVRILHLTDIHPDLHYKEEGNADCGKPMCCREEDGPPGPNPAGHHGSYTCDMPEHAMINVLDEAAARYDEYEFVIMSGDLVHHSVWSTNTSDNINHFNAFNIPLVQKFEGVPIYPVIGNHEPHPCNLFVPRKHWHIGGELDQAWMFDALTTPFVGVLPTEALEMYKTKGYYTLLHKPGFRIIALNTNFCYVANFWILAEMTDQEGQLQWLADELLKAENAGERVYIIGHIPPGSSDCWTHWNERFSQIVVRFEDTIMAQFYGHTHNDETGIFFDKSVDPPRPADFFFIGVSTTAYTDINPGYKVYYADGARGDESTWEILNHETWVYNLSLANSAGSPGPEWYKLYSAKEEFHLKSFRPYDLYDMVLRMLFDGPLFQKYQRAYYKDSHVAGVCREVQCKIDALCKLVTAESGDFSHCKRLEEILTVGPSPNSTTTVATTSTQSTTTVVTTTTTEGSTTIEDTTTSSEKPTTDSTTESTTEDPNGAVSIAGNVVVVLASFSILHYNY